MTIWMEAMLMTSQSEVMQQNADNTSVQPSCVLAAIVMFAHIPVSHPILKRVYCYVVQDCTMFILQYLRVSYRVTLEYSLHPYPCQSKSIPRCASVYINVSCTIYSCILYSCIPYWPMINIKAKQRCVMACPHSLPRTYLCHSDVKPRGALSELYELTEC